MSEPTNYAIPPQVAKKEEYKFFIQCVEDGLWKNSTYLAELCDVTRDTIREWKTTKPALDARRRANRELMRSFKGRGDIEKRLKEAGLVFDPERLDITTAGQPIFGGQSVNNALSTNDSNS